MKQRVRLFLWAVAFGPAGAALLFLVAASVFPVRLDYRTFQASRRLECVGLPPSDGNYLFCSADNELNSYNIAAYALRQRTWQWCSQVEATN